MSDAAGTGTTDASTALATALAGAGLDAHVQAEGRLALLTADADRFAAPAARADATRLARALGFTHVALLLDGDAPPGAGVTEAADDGAADAPR